MLWLYNLHYFDDLNSEDAKERTYVHRNLLGRWIGENPPAEGVGWEPYPCSLRIVNWIKWFLSGNEPDPKWLISLATQADWLSKNIEWHLLGNHLFANAKALVFAGLFFEGKDADEWLQRGLSILDGEISEQILEDGGQFELSPMYHSIALEDMLDLVNASRVWDGGVPRNIVEHWEEVVSSMLRWANIMCHPDGQIALFNDSAFSIAADIDDLNEYANRLGLTFDGQKNNHEYLHSSGFVRAESEDCVLFVDVGKIGPDYLPGHAHADSLGFELSLFAMRWFVDTGCSTYEVSDERLRQRGTAAHNTVTVDDQDSSEVWSSFRVARRAMPIDVEIQSECGAHRISAGHDGYNRLPGKVSHHREFSLRSRSLVINDQLSGRFNTAQANFLLHPDVSAELRGENLVMERNGNKVQMSVSGGTIELINSTWHPEFGKSIPTQRIAVCFFADTLSSQLAW